MGRHRRIYKSGPPVAASLREQRADGPLLIPCWFQEAWFQSGGGLVQVVPEDLRPRGVAQLGHGLGFDLADALARDSVDLADFV